VQYVIHRMCACRWPTTTRPTAARPRRRARHHRPARAGETLKIDASNLAVAAQIHYVVTARVFGRAAAMW
jgi:hypothetical protein